MRWLWSKFVNRPARRFPTYFEAVFWLSLLGLFAFPFTLGFGEPYWWAWILPWLVLAAACAWWLGWLPRKRDPEDVP